MKSFGSFLVASAVFAFALLGSLSSMMAQAPSPAVMFHSPSVKENDDKSTYTVTLSWQNGMVTSANPLAESYNIYRAWGFGENDSEYSMVGTVNMATPADPNKWTFTDNQVKKGVYTYYVRAVAASVEGERSPGYFVVCPARYCIGPDQRFQFTTTPNTFALPGEKYTYNAVAEHPSIRIWGFIRYQLVEGPDGMTIDNKSGELTWDIPKDASGQISIKIKSYMQEYEADTTILYQEWTLRLAEPFEVKQLASGVKEEAVVNSSVFPNPSENMLHFSFTAASGKASISVVTMLGITVLSEEHELANGQNSIDINTINLPVGSYFVRVNSGTKESILPFVVAR